MTGGGWSGGSAPERGLQLAEEALALGAFVPGLGFLELAQDILLAGAQPSGRFDLDLYHQVAAPPPLQHRHAGAALAQLAPGLDADRDLDGVGLAVEAGDFDRAAKGGGREADRDSREQRRAFALEQRVRADLDEDVEIAGRGAERPGLAF